MQVAVYARVSSNRQEVDLSISVELKAPSTTVELGLGLSRFARRQPSAFQYPAQANLNFIPQERALRYQLREMV